MREEYKSLINQECVIMFDKIDYHFNYDFDRQKGRTEVAVKDSVIVHEIEDDIITVDYTRSLTWKENPPFDMEVRCKIFLTVISGQEMLIKEDKNFAENLKADIEQNPPEYFQEAYAKTSLLISDVTAQVTGCPIITPPVFINDEK